MQNTQHNLAIPRIHGRPCIGTISTLSTVRNPPKEGVRYFSDRALEIFPSALSGGSQRVLRELFLTSLLAELMASALRVLLEWSWSTRAVPGSVRGDSVTIVVSAATMTTDHDRDEDYQELCRTAAAAAAAAATMFFRLAVSYFGFALLVHVVYWLLAAATVAVLIYCQWGKNLL